jgi:hypothetical protein
MFKSLSSKTSNLPNNAHEEDQDFDSRHQYATNFLDDRREAEMANIARRAVNGYIDDALNEYAAYRAHVDIEEIDDIAIVTHQDNDAYFINIAEQQVHPSPQVDIIQTEEDYKSDRDSYLKLAKNSPDSVATAEQDEALLGQMQVSPITEDGGEFVEPDNNGEAAQPEVDLEDIVSAATEDDGELIEPESEDNDNLLPRNVTAVFGDEVLLNASATLEEEWGFNVAEDFRVNDTDFDLTAPQGWVFGVTHSLSGSFEFI